MGGTKREVEGDGPEPAVQKKVDLTGKTAKTAAIMKKSSCESIRNNDFFYQIYSVPST